MNGNDNRQNDKRYENFSRTNQMRTTQMNTTTGMNRTQMGETSTRTTSIKRKKKLPIRPTREGMIALGELFLILLAIILVIFLVVKGMQDKQMEVLEFIKMISDMGMKSTGGLSNNSNGMPKHIRPIMDSALVAMAMMNGLTSAIVNPNDLRLMETIKSCDVFKGNTLYADSYLEI